MWPAPLRLLFHRLQLRMRLPLLRLPTMAPPLNNPLLQPNLRSKHLRKEPLYGAALLFL